MSNYNIKPITLPSLLMLDAKEKRKKDLEAVRQRRYKIAKDRREKEQRAYQQNEEYREYQDMLKA